MSKRTRARQPFRRIQVPQPVNIPAGIPIIGQRNTLEDDAPKLEETRDVPEPMFGHVIFEMIPVKESAGGIIVPEHIPGDEAADRPRVAKVVKSHPYFIIGVHMIRSPLKPGDRIVLRNPLDGARHPVDMPKNYAVTSIANVAVYHAYGERTEADSDNEGPEPIPEASKVTPS